MELMNGYKQTDIGPIPVDWEVSTVKKEFEICNNLRLPISEQKRKEMQGEYAYYGPTKIQDYINVFRVEGEFCLIGEDGDHFLKWLEMPMTILANGKFNVNNHAHLIKGTKNLTAWFYYYFNNRDITNHLTRQGAGRYKLSKKSLEEIPIALPSNKTEQNIITNALNDADALIGNLEKLVEKKKAIRQGTMQHLLKPKLHWSTRRLEDICQVKKGQLITDSTRVNGSVPVIAGGKTPAYFHNKANRYGKTITISGSGASAGYVAFHSTPIFASDCSTIEESDDYEIEFIYYVLHLYQDKIYKRQTGGAQPHIHPNDLYPIEIPFPPKLEQQNIAKTLREMDVEIEKLHHLFAKSVLNKI